MTVPDTVRRFFAQAKVKNNWMVGRGIMLAPPISGTAVEDGGRWLVRVSGNDGSGAVDHGLPQDYEILVDDAVIGRFRPQLTLVDNSGPIPSFITLAPFSERRVHMLNTVPVDGQISAAEFMERNPTKKGKIQSQAARRWRELRLEYGFAVSTINNKQDYYRAPEPLPINHPQPRPDMELLNEVMVPQILGRGDALECAKCGRAISEPGDKEGEEFPGVCDHRRPIAYGGDDEIGNLQFLCMQCNNTKAHVCQRCPIEYQCQRCTWAFPHEFIDTIMLHLDEEMAVRLRIAADAAGVGANTFVRSMLVDRLP